MSRRNIGINMEVEKTNEPGNDGNDPITPIKICAQKRILIKTVN